MNSLKYFGSDDENVPVILWFTSPTLTKLLFSLDISFIIFPCISFESWHSSSNIYLYLDWNLFF